MKKINVNEKALVIAYYIKERENFVINLLLTLVKIKILYDGKEYNSKIVKNYDIT